MSACEAARAAFARTLDGEPADLSAMRHGLLCEACGAHARELMGLDEELHDLLGEVEEAPAGFAERLLERLPEESPEELGRRARAGSSAETLGWVAATLVLVLGIERGVQGIAWGALATEVSAWVQLGVTDLAASAGEASAWLPTSGELAPWASWGEPSLFLLGAGLLVALILPALAGQGLERHGARG